MYRLGFVALLGGMLVLSGGLVGQEPKKDDPKKTVGQDAKKDDAKKDESPTKIKGKLPSHWGKIGLTDAQKQAIYGIQAKYDPEIDKLEAKIVEMKATRDKEMKAVLTADQKKALEAAIIGKDMAKDKDK